MKYGPGIRRIDDRIPWSLRTTIITLGLLIVFSFLTALIIAFLTSLINALLLKPFQHSQVSIFIEVASLIIYAILTSLYLKKQLNKHSISIKEVWGETKNLKISHTIFSITTGIIFMIIIMLLRKSLLGSIDIPPPNTGFHDRSLYFIKILVVTTLAPVFEEFLFRGLAYPIFAKDIGLFLAKIFSSIAFALYHIDFFLFPFIWMFCFLFGAFIMGFISCSIFDKTDCLTNSVLFHISANSTLHLVYYIVYYIP